MGLPLGGRSPFPSTQGVHLSTRIGLDGTKGRNLRRASASQELPRHTLLQGAIMDENSWYVHALLPKKDGGSSGGGAAGL